jgi:TetR/AcrR family transcriptional regulator, regulator of cefoperazone and chloramphenicol sensitivity
MDDTAQKILRVAGPIFAEKGFEKATVREIIAQAQVNLAAVNYHFRDKENLYVESVKEAHRQMIEQVPLPDWNHDTTPQAKLYDFVHTMLTRLLQISPEHWQVQLMMREVIQPTAAVRSLVETYIRPQFQVLCGIITELLNKPLPAHELHQIALSIVGQCLHYRFGHQVDQFLITETERKRHFTIPALAEHITRFSLAGIQSAS